MSANIVVVDDTPDNVRLLMSLLSDQGYQIRPALDGPYALEMIRSAPPDLILLDVIMPKMDGFEVCEQLKADARLREIPVIFISALTAVFDKVKAFSLGAVDYIAKPFQTAEVLARINTHLALRQLQKNLQQEVVKRSASEEQLRQLNQELQEVNANKNKFFSIIAHDLRNPVTTFSQLCELIVENFDRYSAEDIKRLTILQRDSAQQLNALLDNLLTWANAQQATLEFQPHPVNLKKVIEKNLNLLALNAEKKRITLKSSVHEPIMVYADDHMMNTVVLNLLSNALKFTDAQGTVNVSVTPNGSEVEFAVSDTGIGIPEERLSNLFRIDSKYKQIGTAGERGTGLGLILCKEFVERHGGKIWVESARGKGTTFKFTLPKSETTLPECQRFG